MIIYLLLEHERFQNIRNHTARVIGKEGVTFLVGFILFLSFPGIQLTQLLFGRLFIWIFLKSKLWTDWKIFIADFLKRIQIENSLAVYKNQISKILLIVTYVIHFIPTLLKRILESILKWNFLVQFWPRVTLIDLQSTFLEKLPFGASFRFWKKWRHERNYRHESV